MTSFRETNDACGDEDMLTPHAAQRTDEQHRTLPAAYLMELRERIRSDGYTSPYVIDTVARRILKSCEL
jgi:hypothetical protein